MYGYNGMGLGGMYGRQMMQQFPQFGGGMYGGQFGGGGSMPSPYLMPQGYGMPQQVTQIPMMQQQRQMPMQQMQQIPLQIMPTQSMMPQAMPQRPQMPQMGLGGMYGRQFNGY